MQKEIFIASAKFPTLATISEHRFGSFVRTFYEFEYTKNNDPEVYQFRGSNINYCPHGHNWSVCCSPKLVIPEPSAPVSQNSKAENPEDKSNPPIPTKEESQPKAKEETDSPKSPHSEENQTRLLDDPAEIIQSAPLANHYLLRLNAHESASKYDVDLIILLPGSKRPRKSFAPPRPPNSFMVYSMFVKSGDNLDLFLPTRKKVGKETNADIGALWHSLPAKDREFFAILAEFANHIHQELYPNYKYQPHKKAPGTKKSKKTRRK